MARLPSVKTRYGWGKLFKIAGDKAIVEFDYAYLVELSLKDVELDDVDLSDVEMSEAGSNEDER